MTVHEARFHKSRENLADSDSVTALHFSLRIQIVSSSFETLSYFLDSSSDMVFLRSENANQCQNEMLKVAGYTVRRNVILLSISRQCRNCRESCLDC